MRKLCVNSTFNLIYDDIALKQLKKMDKQTAKRITTWITERLKNCENPRLWGSALKGELGECWRYRIGDYRVLCKILNNELIVLILEIEHRKSVYQTH